MGAEFLRKTRKTHAKHIDDNRVKLGTPTLFTQTPENQPRSALASISGGKKLECGEKVIVEPKGGDLLAYKGNTVVAKFKNPPADIIAAIEKCGGVAKGKVQQVNKLSKTADISIC